MKSMRRGPRNQSSGRVKMGVVSFGRVVLSTVTLAYTTVTDSCEDAMEYSEGSDVSE